MRPYTPLELAGRDIYVREGCYTCHSQMIRPFRDEVERYGHYSLAAESMYDHPFQWGSQAHRAGPRPRRRQVFRRLARRSTCTTRARVVPESIMPPYAFLDRDARYRPIAGAAGGADGASACPTPTRWSPTPTADLEAQADRMRDGAGLAERYAEGAAAATSTAIREV